MLLPWQESLDVFTSTLLSFPASTKPTEHVCDILEVTFLSFTNKLRCEVSSHGPIKCQRCLSKSSTGSKSCSQHFGSPKPAPSATQKLNFYPMSADSMQPFMPFKMLLMILLLLEKETPLA